nr:MAG: hypothetical protein [Ips partiti-like virus 1]
MSCIEDFDDIFGVGIPPIEEIPIDEEQEAKQYMISMYERLNRLREKHALEEESISSSSASGHSTSVVFSEDSAEEKEPDAMQIEKFLAADDDGIFIPVPILKKDGLKRWSNVVEHHERRVKEVISKLDKLNNHRELIHKIRAAASLEQYQTSIRIKDKIQRNLALRTLAVGAMEKIAFDAIGVIAFNLKDLECVLDTITNGVWVTPPKDEHVKRFISDMGTGRMVLTRRFNFNARQAESLVSLLFSFEPDVRARAKLDLSASVNYEIFRELVQYPGRTLEVACAEAMLTKSEILYLIFPKVNTQRICLACRTAVELNNVVYHGKCRTVEWLTRYCKFKYDETDQCIVEKKDYYLNPQSRRLLVELLNIHAKLKRDVVTRDGNETILWKRTEDGRLVKTQIRSQREEDLVGSYAWRKAHGLAK